MPKERNKKKLLIVSQYFYPEHFRINDMCAEWVKRGYDVTVLTGIPNYPQGNFFSGYGWFRKRREDIEDIHIIRIPIISRGTSNIRLALNYFSFVISGFLWSIFSREKPSLVFAFEVSPMTQILPAIWFARRRKVPCLAYVQDLWPECFMEATGIRTPLLIKPIDKMADYIYHYCQKIFVTSSSFKRAVLKRGVDEDKVIFWPQYAEEFYRPSTVVSPLMHQDERFTIVFTGNIGTAQGLELLPRVSINLKNRGHDVHFVVVGEGRGKPLLVETIRHHQVEESFTFLGQKPPEEIPGILAGADAAYLSFSNKPLYQMTLPAKLQSYMACGMPILASAEGETKSIIEDAACGMCCETGDDEALTNMIIDFMALPVNMRQSMGVNGQNFARKHYLKSKLMDEMDCYFKDAFAAGNLERQGVKN